MENFKRGIILVGHGGLPSDLPSEIVEKFMRLHKARVKAGGEVTSQEVDLDSTIRRWKRTPENDPYKSGLETLASHMEQFLKDDVVKTAYNEFCYPTIEEAVEELSKENVSKIILVTTMITRGGSHSEREIPEELKDLKQKFKDIDIQYAWPFDMDAFALFLTTHINIFDPLVITADN